MFRSATIAVVDAAAIAYRISMQDGRTRRRRRGEAAASFALCFTLRRNNRVRTVRRFTRHAADELSELQEASLKNSGFPGRLPKTFSARRPLLDVRDDDEGQQTTGGTPRTVKMAQERDDLVYLAKLAEQAERFDEMARRRRGGIITPFVYLS